MTRVARAEAKRLGIDSDSEKRYVTSCDPSIPELQIKAVRSQAALRDRRAEEKRLETERRERSAKLEPLVNNFNDTSMGRAAVWAVHGDADGVTLQIELGRNRAITLSCSEADGVQVALWVGNGEQRFDRQITPDGFRDWISDVIVGCEESRKDA